MILGPNLIYQCPNCKTFYSKRSLVSGNTFGAKMYSDGKQIAPMLPGYANLIKCQECNSFLWLNKMEVVGELGSSPYRNRELFPIPVSKTKTDQEKAWKNARSVNRLTIDEYNEALENKIYKDMEEERYIRMHLWWAYNDRVRSGNEIFQDSNDEIRWMTNSKLLIILLDAKVINDRIMQAELYRNISDFPRCLKKINSIKTKKLAWLKERFTLECEKKNPWVVEL